MVITLEDKMNQLSPELRKEVEDRAEELIAEEMATINMSKPLEKEFHYFLDNQAALVENYNGRVIVIKDCEVIGDYATETEAIEKTSEKEELGTFLVQKCEPGDECYTQRFHSRVSFAENAL